MKYELDGNYWFEKHASAEITIRELEYRLKMSEDGATEHRAYIQELRSEVRLLKRKIDELNSKLERPT